MSVRRGGETSSHIRSLKYGVSVSRLVFSLDWKGLLAFVFCSRALSVSLAACFFLSGALDPFSVSDGDLWGGKC